MEILKKSNLISSTKTYEVIIELDTMYECTITEETPVKGSKNIFSVTEIKQIRPDDKITTRKEDLRLTIVPIIIAFIEKNVIKLN